MRAARLILIAMAGALAPAIAAPAVAQQTPTDTGVGIRLVDVPTSLQNDPRAQRYIVDHVQPGTRIQRHIEISDNTSHPEEVDLYPAGATITSGEFVPAAGRTKNDLAGWTTVDPPHVSLAPRAKATATVTIAVPDGVAPGERYAAVFAEPPPATSATGVAVINRVGVRIYLSVGTGAEPATDFRIDSLTARRLPDRTPVVSASVHNTGGRALDIAGTLKLSDGPGGLEAGPFQVKLGTTLGIGDTEAVSVTLDPRIPSGPWEAQITLTSGEVTREARARILFPDDAGASAPPVKATPIERQRRLLLPIASSLFLVVLIALAVLLVWLRRRRKRDEDNAGPTSST